MSGVGAEGRALTYGARALFTGRAGREKAPNTSVRFQAAPGDAGELGALGEHRHRRAAAAREASAHPSGTGKRRPAGLAAGAKAPELVAAPRPRAG